MDPAPSASLCERCELTDETWYCVNCISYYCQSCWDKLGPHKPGKIGLDGDKHEQTDPKVLWLHDILSPNESPEVQEALHRNDYDTTWFGVEQEEGGPVFQEYGRYASIMADSMFADTGTRYPQLVSFIGQAGAGKSTLVKMLIEHQQADSSHNMQRLASPVVSSVNNNLPTSADVHLYSDPGTYTLERPVLYADCEGLEGGEVDPLAVKVKNSDDTSGQRSHKRAALHKIRKVTRSSRLEWATTPEMRRRQFAVTELYPRLLYTFSDVIVFVLRNSKTLEQVIIRLLDWAFASIEKSLNQPLLPHAIIALNATDNAIDPRQWDIAEATNTLLRDVDSAMDLVPKLAKYAEYWRSRGKKIKTMKDLLECFYTSITVGRLYREIKVACNRAYFSRQKIRMLCNADDLQTYLRFAFDHFSQHLDTPFDFSEISLRNNPIPQDFGGNVLKLAIAIQEQTAEAGLRPTGNQIFEPLSGMVASCIMLDLTRQHYQGTALDLLEKHYFDYCVQALREFCERHRRCAFSNARGNCVNTRSGHSRKGHQNVKGKVLAAGDYIADFPPDDYVEVWKDNLRRRLDQIRQTLQQEALSTEGLSEHDLAPRLHLRYMNEFYSSLGSASLYLSQSACFCCLREMAQHPLPCGHVLCTKCIKAHGTVTENYWIHLSHCPLHKAETDWSDPFLVQLKPDTAGVRVLTLDGGGIRGIVELEVLRAVQNALGGKIPIQAFFDLIVGTSTGGIISLGLGAKGWTIQECIEKFKKLVGKAFTPRDFHGLPFFQSFAFMHQHSLYKTRPFEAALQKAFGEDSTMFNSGPANGRHSVKVAVTSATGTGQSAVVIANYNRKDDQDSDCNYIFERSDNTQDAMMIWEAARATSAAPKYFKPFQSRTTRKEYWDGALYHNNPVFVSNHERKLLWPDSELDILLSIGTGKKPGSSVAARSVTPQRLISSPTDDSSKARVDWAQKPKWQHLWSVLVNRVHDILDSDKIWASFMMDVQPETLSRRRYQRLNVDLGIEPPELDAVDQVENLAFLTASRLQKQPEYQKHIRTIAAQLVATSFYFERSSAPPLELAGGHSVEGQFRARFLSSSEELRHLGTFLRQKQTSTFQPHFSVTESEDLREVPFTQRIPITEDVIQNMIIRAVFEHPLTSITVSKEGARTSVSLHLDPISSMPVSGFPRCLLHEVQSDLTRVTSRTRSPAQSVASLPDTPPTGSPKPSSGLFSNFRNRLRPGSRLDLQPDHVRSASVSSLSMLSLRTSGDDDGSSSISMPVMDDTPPETKTYEDIRVSVDEIRVENEKVLSDTASAMGIAYF